MKNVGLLCIATLMLCGALYAQSPDSAYLDTYFLAVMDTFHLPGLAASVVKDGEIIWTGTYGWAKIEDSIPATDTTIWNLGSISKTVTAVAAMKAWEEDLFELDENLNDRLPFNVVHYYYPNDTITPRNILIHTSCVEDRWDLWDSLIVFGGDSPVSLDTFMYNYFNPAGYWYHHQNFINYPPGSRWEYSNVGNSLVGYLTESVADTSFPHYCQQHIFDPLGMNRTSWFYSNLDTNNVAMTYSYYNGQYYPDGYFSSCIYPSSALKSSLLDLTHFLMMFMQYGELDSVTVLDSTTVALMRTIQCEVIGFPNAYMGITWWYFESQLSGRWLWGHTGAWFNAAATMTFCPAENTGVIIITNRGVGTFYEMGPWAQTLYEWALQYGIAENTVEPAAMVTLHVNPNPFSKQTTVSLGTGYDPQHASLEIYDATGRLVKSFSLSTPYSLLPPEVSWDGRDDQNRLLPSGTYFVKLQTDDQVEVKKVLLVR